MTRQLAIVLGGGGARGALQVGALRALYEYGCRPDLLIGTSAGAINAAYLALHGFSPLGLEALADAWDRAGQVDLLPSNYIRLALRDMLRPSSANPASRIREFFIANGIVPSLRFADLQPPQLTIVSSDLNTGKPVLHGQSPEDSVLDALLLSTALPPWVMPVKTQGHYLMDGAVVSSLPIQPALQMGATDIVALDLTDARDPVGHTDGFGLFINRLTYAVEQRQVDLELEVSKARGVPVRYLDLTAVRPIPLWDFRHAEELIARGYQFTRAALEPSDGAHSAATSRLPDG